MAHGAALEMSWAQFGMNWMKSAPKMAPEMDASPPKTVEMVRKLVEQDQVAFVFNTLGTPTNSAIHKYMNQQKTPQLFVATGATKWGDPQNFP